jgi:hypothetical protein
MLLAALTRAGGMVEGRTPAIDDDGGSGIVRRRIALPVSSGGWGMRRMETLADVAFLGGAASAIPAFGDRQVPGPDSEEGEETVTVPGMFPSLALDLLGPSAFDEYDLLLGSECRPGCEQAHHVAFRRL